MHLGECLGPMTGAVLGSGAVHLLLPQWSQDTQETIGQTPISEIMGLGSQTSKSLVLLLLSQLPLLTQKIEKCSLGCYGQREGPCFTIALASRD